MIFVFGCLCVGVSCALAIEFVKTVREATNYLEGLYRVLRPAEYDLLGKAGGVYLLRFICEFAAIIIMFLSGWILLGVIPGLGKVTGAMLLSGIFSALGTVVKFLSAKKSELDYGPYWIIQPVTTFVATILIDWSLQ